MPNTPDFAQYLNTNYSPSEDEITALKHLIEDREAVAATLAAKIKENRAAMTEMEEELVGHRRFILEHSMLLAPIRRIPLDVLTLIFETCVEPRAIDSPSCPSSAKLSHVCGGWRQLALRTPSLWTHIYVEAPQLDLEWTPLFGWYAQMDALLHRTEARVERSSSSPIDLSLRIGGIASNVKYHIRAKAIQAYGKLFDVIRPTTSRWRSLYVHWDVQVATKSVIDLFDGPQLQFSLLRMVKLQAYNSEVSKSARKRLLDRLSASSLFAAPALRKVTLVGGPWNNMASAKSRTTSGLYNSITHFTCQAYYNSWGRTPLGPRLDTAQALRILGALPNLVFVEISLCSVGLGFPPLPQPISLPHLVSMTLCGLPVAKGFAPSLSLPSLESLRLLCKDTPINYQNQGADGNGYEELLLQWGPQLVDLSLCHNGLAQQTLPRCFAVLSNVKRLDLYGESMNFRRLNDEADRDILHQLCIPDILPRLEELALHNLSNLTDGVVERAVVELLSRRVGQFPPGCPTTSGVRRLRKVYIRFLFRSVVDVCRHLQQGRSVCLDNVHIDLNYPAVRLPKPA